MKPSLMIKALVVLGLTAAACGSSSKSSTDTSAATTAAGPAATTAAGAAATTAASSGATTAPAPTGTPITIGVIADQTSTTSASSSDTVLAMQVAVNSINKAGGVLGRPLQLKVVDGQNNPTLGPTLTRQLVQSDKASAIMYSASSTQAQQSKATLKDLKVLGIAPTGLSTSVAEPPDNDFMFSLATPVTVLGQIYASAFAKTNVKKIAVFTENDPTIAGLLKLILDPIQKSGVTVVDTESVDKAATDVSVAVARIKDSAPDGVLMVDYGLNTEALFVNGLATALPTTPAFGLATLVNQPQTWSVLAPGAPKNDVWTGSLSNDNQLTKQVAAEMAAQSNVSFNGAKYNGALTAYEAQGWDAIQLVAQSITQAKTADDGTAVKTALESITDFKAAYGQPGFTLSFSATKHVANNSPCGIVLQTFDSSNRPGPPWSEYQPTC